MSTLIRLGFGFLGSALSAVVHAQPLPYPDEMTLQSSLAQVAITGVAGELASDEASAFASAEFESNYGSAALRKAELRGRAFVEDSIGETLATVSAVTIQLRNTSPRDAALVLESDDWRFQVSAGFDRTFGSGDGLTGNTLFAVFAVAVVNDAQQTFFEGAGGVLYTFTQQTGEAPQVGFSDVSSGGFVLEGAPPTMDELLLTIVPPMIVVAPGQTLGIVISVSGTATAMPLLAGGPGYSATTDFGNTARLTLALPPGWGLNSSTPLDWIATSAVPEPEPWQLLAIGLLVFPAVRRRLLRR